MTNAIQLCRGILRKKSKSFALAQKLLPATCRDPSAIVYAWCRRADDAVDELPPDAASLALERLERELDEVYTGVAQQDPLLEAFRQVVLAKTIPKQYPAELLLGMRMDLERTCYETLPQLSLYCYRVAGTVGLMMCHVMDLRDPRALKHAAHLGIAMQLTNICRDVVEDWGRQRVYVPLDMLGLPANTKVLGDFPAPHQQRFAQAVERLLTHADALYASGDRGLVYLSWRSAWAVAVARLVYARIGNVIRARQCDVTMGRARVRPLTKLWLLLRGFALAIWLLPAMAFYRSRNPQALPALRYPGDVLPG